MTLGSLFDGSGGFPLAGLLNDITPLWASEVEPFPIMVTSKRLPFMKHYGDVSKLDGGKIEPVDIITFGSPCQDMSVAGRRSGLDGSRSSLFYEAIRIIKEMRKATNNTYPKYAVWENVPGAFSSSEGEDFRCVLESLCGVVDETVFIPKPKKWEDAGSIVGDGYSVSWRILDAQYWGVPQRRKRIYLVTDFTDECAEKILFESESLSGYSAESVSPWQRASFDTEKSTGETGVVCLNDQGGERMDVSEDVTNTLRVQSGGHHPIIIQSAGFLTEPSANARSIGYEEEKSPTLRTGVVPAAIVLDNHPTDSRVKICEDGIIPTLTSRCGTGGNNVPLLMEKASSLDCKNLVVNNELSGTLQAKNNGGYSLNFINPVAYGVCAKDSNSMKSDNPHSGFYEADTSRCLDKNGGNPCCNQGGICVCEPVAFAQNQRDEVRVLGDKAGAIAAEPGIHQQTYVIQGSVIGREDKNGPQGDGVSEDVSFTLNTIDRHAVAYGIDRAGFNQGKNALYSFAIEEELEPTMVARGPNAVAHPTYTTSKASYHTMAEENVANTLVASNYKDPPTVFEEPYYIVRRLTPTECARLQGFPDWWCGNLETEKPTEEELQFWADVWETHRRVISHTGKPKTEAQLRKWLKDPYSDAAEYKMWGNGIALPCARFVLAGIVWHEATEDENQST